MTIADAAQFLTDFADEAVILPVAATVAALLALLGWWRGASAWAVTVCGVLGTMGLLKMVFIACAGPLAGLGIHSPSGHTAASAVTYGGLALLFGRSRLPPLVLAVLPLAIALFIGTTRVVLHAHVPVEALVGGLVGLAGAAVLLPLAGPQPPLRHWPVAASAIGIMLALHGVRLQAEQAIHTLALLSWLQLEAMCRV